MSQIPIPDRMINEILLPYLFVLVASGKIDNLKDLGTKNLSTSMMKQKLHRNIDGATEQSSGFT